MIGYMLIHCCSMCVRTWLKILCNDEFKIQTIYMISPFWFSSSNSFYWWKLLAKPGHKLNKYSLKQSSYTCMYLYCMHEHTKT